MNIIANQYGATHYSTMKDGVTPQMYYKQQTEPINDGTTRTRWVYLSHAGIWMGSSMTDEEINNLKEIK
jgi:predicted metalloendopeptidase